MGLFDDVAASGSALAKSAVGWIVGSEDDVSAEDMAKAMRGIGMAPAQPTPEKPRAMFHDPYSITDWGGWRQRPSSLTYEIMRETASANGVISAIINHRTHQVAAFCRPQQGRYDKGYRVQLRDRRDKRKGMTPAEQKEAESIERMLETTGLLLPEEKPADRDSFKAFCKKAVRDVLTYDQWCWEKIRDQKGRPSRFVALPSETIRPAVADVEHMDPEQHRDRVAYVQVYENTVISEFGVDDLAWCIQNPRSDLRANGFGYSPIEMIIRLITAWLFGFEYNQKFFTQGSAIKGLLNIKGAIPDRQLKAFRRMWYTMISGVGNAWKTPILNSDEIQWVSMHTSNRDMEFGAWIDYVTKLICAAYGIDPVEINFIFGSSAGSSLFDRRPNQAEVTESKDKGLAPLLDHIADHLNTHLIWELNPDFEFGFVGFDAQSEEAERKAKIEEVKAFKTVNEIRAEMDEEPLPKELGDVILESNWLQWAQAKAAEDEGAESMGEGGESNTIDDLFGGLGGPGGEGGGDDGEDGPPGGPQGPPGLPGGQAPGGALPAGGGGAEAQEASESGGAGEANTATAESDEDAAKKQGKPFGKSHRLKVIDLYLGED